MNIAVVLKQDFPSLGFIGDEVRVRAGFARNFLIPRGIAVEGASRERARLEHTLSHVRALRAKAKAVAENLAKQLGEVALSFSLATSASGKSFGSITLRDIEQAFKEKGFVVDRRQLRLSDVIKKAGEYEVLVKLHAEVSTPVKILVTALVQKPAAEEGERKPRARRASKKPEQSATETTPTETGKTDQS